jgi:hypothetical protein
MKIQEFDYSVDLLQAILWQYNDATNLLSLLSKKQSWYNTFQTEFWVNWYNTVFNLATTTPTFFGMAVWSIILQLPLFVPFETEPTDKPLWGFNAYDPTFPDLENTYKNFGLGNFSTQGQNFPLTIGEQQFLLRLRYFQLSTLGNIAGIPTSTTSEITTYSINTFLTYLCATSNIGFTGQMYVIDYLDMTIAYVFTTTDFPYWLLKALIATDILPRPAGVGIRYILQGQQAIWGFSSNYQNFENGTFIHYGLF